MLVYQGLAPFDTLVCEMNANHTSTNNLTPLALLLSEDDFMYTAVRLALEQCFWMMQPVNLPSRAGEDMMSWSQRSKDFVLITGGRRSATGFIVIWLAPGKSRHYRELLFSKVEEEQVMWFLSFYIFLQRPSKVEGCDLEEFVNFPHGRSKAVLSLSETFSFVYYPDSFVFNNPPYLQPPS